MAVFPLSEIKQWFLTGLKPTQTNFHDMLDSFVHKSEGIDLSAYVAKAGATMTGDLGITKVFFAADNLAKFEIDGLQRVSINAIDRNIILERFEGAVDSGIKSFVSLTAVNAVLAAQDNTINKNAYIEATTSGTVRIFTRTDFIVRLENNTVKTITRDDSNFIHQIDYSSITGTKTLIYPNASGTIPISVNGQTADSNGAITISVGGGVNSVTGTSGRITSTGGLNPIINIDSVFEALLAKRAETLVQFANTTSAQLASVISDETGAGVVVFNTSPVFVTGIGTNSSTFALFNTGASTLNAFGQVANANLCASANVLTINFGHGDTGTGIIKTINFGTGGLSGSITNINIGSSVSGALGTVTIRLTLAVVRVGTIAGTTWDIIANNNPILRFSSTGVALVTLSNNATASTFTASGSLNFVSQNATTFSVGSNQFNVVTGNNGSVNFTNVVSTSSGRDANSITNTQTISGGGSGLYAGIKFLGAINGNNVSARYYAIDFSQTIGTWAGTFTLINSNLASGTNRRFINHTGTAESAFNGNLNLIGSAKIATYSGITTVAMGLAPIVADFNVTSRSTAYTNQNIYSVTATGLYEITISIDYLVGQPLWVDYCSITYQNLSLSITQRTDSNYFTTYYGRTATFQCRCDSGSSILFSTVLLGATNHNIDIIVKRLR